MYCVTFALKISIFVHTIRKKDFLLITAEIRNLKYKYISRTKWEKIEIFVVWKSEKDAHYSNK